MLETTFGGNQSSHPHIYFLTLSPRGLHSQCDIASVSAKTKPTYHNKADIKYNAETNEISDTRCPLTRTNTAGWLDQDPAGQLILFTAGW